MFRNAMGSLISQPSQPSQPGPASSYLAVRQSQVTARDQVNSSVDKSGITLSSIAWKPETVQDNLTYVFEENVSQTDSSVIVTPDESFNIFSGKLNEDKVAAAKGAALAQSDNRPIFSKNNLSAHNLPLERSPSEAQFPYQDRTMQHRLSSNLMSTTNDPRKSGKTVGVSEEILDSVHSLMPPSKGYYDWKRDNQPPPVRLVQVPPTA